MTPNEFITKYYPFAKAVEKETGLSAIAILGQAALESGWGKSAPQNMFFGVKAGANWKGKKQLLKTFEYFNDDKQGHRFPEVISIVYNEKKRKYLYTVRDYFRAYDTPYDSFKDHVKVFQWSNYASAWAVRTDYKSFFTAIQNCKYKYSTSPTYAKTLIDLCEKTIIPEINKIPS